MRRIHLAIDHAELPAPKLSGEMRQRDLRSVADPAEHGFAVEHVPDADAIQTAHEPVFHPHFHRMRVTQSMQRAICRDHVFAYPCATMMFPSTRLRAGCARRGAGT